MSCKRRQAYRHIRTPGSCATFWEFPTVSMGLGPIMAIYQARFNHYLVDRGIKPDAAASRSGRISVTANAMSPNRWGDDAGGP